MRGRPIADRRSSACIGGRARWVTLASINEEFDDAENPTRGCLATRASTKSEGGRRSGVVARIGILCGVNGIRFVPWRKEQDLPSRTSVREEQQVWRSGDSQEARWPPSVRVRLFPPPPARAFLAADTFARLM